MPSNGAIIAGAAYVRQITGNESDRRARSAFQALAMRHVPPAGRVLDFGSGPGIDARHYAERGLKVEAFDIDPQMCDFFAMHCRDFIASDQITLRRGEYRDFVAAGDSRETHDMDLVTSNFAPLNLVENIEELFAKFHALTGPQGKVLASVLSPYYLGDLKYRWWWRNWLRLWRDGYYFVPGTQAKIFRRRPADFAARCRPYFALTKVYHGLPVSRRFMFLLFEKQPLGNASGR